MGERHRPTVLFARLTIGEEPAMAKRPWICPEPRCAPVHQLANGDVTQPGPGESFICFGRMPQTIEFVYDGSAHRNDLRSCSYTPLKGLIANQENADDWRVIGRAYSTALKALADSDQQPLPGGGE